FALELRGKGTTLLGHQTPLCGEHSRLNGCPVSLDHYRVMKDNGGQAFPSESMYTSEAGMTLRDYFAAKAMQALLHPTYIESSVSKPHSNPLADIPRVAYRYADAMLKARKEGGGE
ncbi:hypothetical protein NB845_08310, partial [Pseudomonas aeruginosa]